MARHLRSLGVGPGALVAICVDRSLEMLAALIGIWRAGGAYVPLDPTYPQERLAFMLKDTGVEVLLAQGRLMKKLPEGAPRVVCLDQLNESGAGEEPANTVSGASPDNLAYVMYTSGSTGRPKGVEILHGGVVRLLFGVDSARLKETEILLQLAPISFDASTLEIWGALLHGGRCVLFPERVPTTQDLGKVLKEQRVSTLWLTASLFNQVVEEAPEVLRPVDQLLVGGEALSAYHVRRALELLPTTQLINGYGPTENTTFTCCYLVPRPLDKSVSSIPIGRPIANTQVFILDRYLKPVPIGVAGELHVGGDGLARGYRNRPDLTAENFVPNPFSGVSGARLYKTGDLVRYLPDGNIEFLGRLDDQIKIRGFRIELGEIEAVLAEHPAVKATAVVVREEATGTKRLVAYVTLLPGSAPTPEDLRNFLKGKLPEYMLPWGFDFLPSLPLTPSGKVDRRGLPAPRCSRAEREEGYVAPRTELEKKLARTWVEVLKLERVSIQDNFFDLGGHSLLAVKLIQRVEKEFGKSLTLAFLFQAPTVKDMAAALSDPSPLEGFPGVIPIQPKGRRPPFFCLGAGPLFGPLALRLGSEQPFLGLGTVESDLQDFPAPFRLEDIAACLVLKLRKFQPNGPYFLGGWCDDGTVAYETAQQLRAQGERVALLVLFEVWNHARWRKHSRLKTFHIRLHHWARRIRFHLADLRTLSMREALANLRDRWNFQLMILGNKIWEACYKGLLRMNGQIGGKLRDFNKIEYVTVRNYLPKPFSGRVVLIRSISELEGDDQDSEMGWRSLISQLEVHHVPGGHRGMFNEPNVEVLAKALWACFLEAQAKDTRSDPAMANSRQQVEDPAVWDPSQFDADSTL